MCCWNQEICKITKVNDYDRNHKLSFYNWIIFGNTLQNIAIMKFTILLMLLGLTVLSCKKETKVETMTKSDSVIIDTMAADSLAAPMPADTMHNANTSPSTKMDTAKVIKK